MRLVHRQPEPRPQHGNVPHETALDAPDIAANEGAPARLNDSEREALLLNVDVSLRVHTRPQLFSWVQGALQSLIPHELLVCGLQESRQGAMRVDNFSTAPVDGQKLNELFQQDVSLVPQLVKQWEENRCQAVMSETERGPFASGALARELARLGVSALLGHGTHDSTGNLTSFFAFCARPGTLTPKQTYLADLVVPY